MKDNLKVALVHYWLLNMRGGEKVLEALCDLFPEAEVFIDGMMTRSLASREKSNVPAQ